MATLAIGTWGLRFSRTTSDFFVASRTVRPGLNASAIGGEYLSAASFLGVAGLVLVFGADMLWYPVGWTAGYLVLLVLVAAPLRRSGAYTLPDFAEARLGSRRVRVAVLGAGRRHRLALPAAAVPGRRASPWRPPSAPRRGWARSIVAAVVLINVTSGGMRSITFVQAFQYWLKLTALLVPACVLLAVWVGDGAPNPADAAAPGDAFWSLPLGDGGAQGLYVTYSLIVATFLGTMGLPHVVVRFYTNPDGRAARRTTLVVLGLLGVFYLLPPVYGALGRLYAPDHAVGASDALVLELPRLMVPGLGGELLTGMVTAGAFAAFLSTSSGPDDRGRRRAQPGRRQPPAQRDHGVPGGRASSRSSCRAPWPSRPPTSGVARTVGLAFAVAASTFCPLLLLGIWWRGLTAAGAVAGLLVGGIGSGCAVGWTLLTSATTGWAAVLLGQPAAWSVPARAGHDGRGQPGHRGPGSRPTPGRFMVRLHTPEAVDLQRGEPADRSSYASDRSATRRPPPADVPAEHPSRARAGDGATVTAVTHR